MTMIIRGGALNSAVSGNNLHFQSDHVAALAGHEPVNFTADHSRSIRDAAGTVEFPGVTQFSADPATAGASTTHHILNFKATLSPEYPGYEAAVDYITALRREGRVPNVSVGIIASDLEVDMEAQRITMVGPYNLNHLALVDVGAMRPADGVGVFEVETPAVLATPGASLQDRKLTSHLMATPSSSDDMVALSMVSMTSTAYLANYDDLVAGFIDKHGFDSPETLALGRLLGRDLSMDELEENPLLNESGDCRYGTAEDGSCLSPAQVFGEDATTALTEDGEVLFSLDDGETWNLHQITPNNPTGTPTEPEGTYVPTQPLPHEGSPEPDQEGEQPMTENIPETKTVPEPAVDAPKPEEPKAPEQVAVLTKELEEKDAELKKARDELAAVAELASRIEAIEKAGSEEKEKRLSEARNRIAAELAEDEDKAVLDTMNEAQLAFLEGKLAEATKKPSFLPYSHVAGTPEKVDEFKAKYDEATAWHEKVYLGKEES